MALVIIKMDRRTFRPMVVGSVVLCLIAGWYAIKWNFANAITQHAENKEVTDLAISLAPGDPQSHYAAAVVYERTLDADDATRSLDEYEMAAALSPYNYLSWLALGKARERNDDAAGADQALARAADLAPAYADVQWAYGNSLIRSRKTDEGFLKICRAATERPEYAAQAVVTAMTMFDGDAEKVCSVMGRTPAMNAALARYLLSKKQYDLAVTAWAAVPADEMRTELKDAGNALLSGFAEAKQFRSAAHVARDIQDEDRPTIGSIFNDGFESPIKAADARLFDWQIGPGAEPQIAVSQEQTHGGTDSLFLRFNAMQAADMRPFSQTVALEPGRAYSIDGFYRAELKGAVAWDIADAADGKSLGKSQSVTGTTDWTTFHINFAVPAGHDGIIIRLTRDGCTSPVCPISGKVWFDDLSLGPQ